MARIARVVAPGIPHHITQRGNRRMEIFFDEADYHEYLYLMAVWCNRCKVRIWSYCLMPNHFPRNSAESSGEIQWGLDLTADFLEGYRGWIKEVFLNPKDPYDAVWHCKFPFQEVRNGDYLSLDSDGRVIYLSHDDGEGHGYVMAGSFNDLLERWVPLGCVGAEDWQWLPFTNGMKTKIDPNCEAAQTWKSLLGRE